MTESYQYAAEAPKRESQSFTLWRTASAISVAVVLLVAVVQSIGAPPLQFRSLYFLLAAAVLVPISIRFVFSEAWHGMLRAPDLLVPFGIAWIVSKSIGWISLLTEIGPYLMFGWQFKLFGLVLNASVFTFLDLCVWSAFASWQIDLIWQWVRNHQITSISPWPCIRRGFWKAMAILIFGTGILLLAMIPGMLLGLIGIFVLGVVWNLLTVALMPIALSGVQPLFRSIKSGIVMSWKLKRKWWLQLVVQLSLLGLVTYLTASYQAGDTFHTSSSFTITAFWAGAFDNHFRWHTKYMAMIQTSPIPIALALLQLIFITLAISMKLHVMKILVVSQGPDDPLVSSIEKPGH